MSHVHNINPSEGIGPIGMALDPLGNVHLQHGPSVAIVRQLPDKERTDEFQWEVLLGTMQDDGTLAEPTLLFVARVQAAFAVAIGYLQAHGDLDRLLAVIGREIPVTDMRAVSGPLAA